MSLHNLPQGAFERVVGHLNKHAMLAFAQTCTKFRDESYRHLYRLSYPMMDTSRGYSPESFEDFMQAPQSGAPAIVKVEFYEVVTKMTHLIFHEPWLESGDVDDICSWIEDIHPESTFDVLTVDIEGVEEEKVQALFQNLDKFNGLVCLAVRGMFTQSTIDSIRCASLRQLDLHHPTFIPLIGSHPDCPNLRSIRYLLPSRPSRMMNEDEMLVYDYHERWDRLEQLMIESINFVIWQGPVQYIEPCLSPFIFFYAEEQNLDPTPMITWLIKSIFAWEGSFEVILGLERFLPKHRDDFLELLHYMLPTILPTKIITPKVGMRLHLRSWDQVSLAATLPDNLHGLHISASDQLDPKLIPAIIRHQRDLRYLTVVLCLHETPDNHPYVAEAQVVSCTHANPHPLPFISLPFAPCMRDLWVLAWWLRMRKHGHYWYAGTEFSESFNKPKFVRRHWSEDIHPEMVAEVREWFNLNTKFNEISVYFVGGGSIKDCFTRDMYWKDTGFIILEEFT